MTTMISAPRLRNQNKAIELPAFDPDSNLDVSMNEPVASNCDYRGLQRSESTTDQSIASANSSRPLLYYRDVKEFPSRFLFFCQEHQIGLLLFLIGVYNNAPYVIMLASAKDVSEGGVALVYIANILPGEFVAFVKMRRALIDASDLYA